MTDWGMERRGRTGGFKITAVGRQIRIGGGRCTPARRMVPLAAMALLALALPGCAAGSLQGLTGQTQITSGSEVQTTLRAEARRAVQPLPAGRPQGSGGFSLGGMLDVLVNGMSDTEMAARRDAADAPEGAEAAAERYLAARGGVKSPDLVAIEADLNDKARNAARFTSAARAVLTWHGQLRASFYDGSMSESDGAKLSALIERDKAVIARTYETLTEQAAVLNEALARVHHRMSKEQSNRVTFVSNALARSVSQLGVLSGKGLNGSGPVG